MKWFYTVHLLVTWQLVIRLQPINSPAHNSHKTPLWLCIDYLHYLQTF